jgi:hypothetical protein
MGGDLTAARDDRPPRGAFLVANLFALATAVLAARGFVETSALDFAPGFEERVPDTVFHAALWLHGALLSAGATRLRPREGMESFASDYLAFLAGQGLCSLLLWVGLLEVAWRGTARVSAALPFLPTVTMVLWAAGPLIALVALFRVRRGGLLLAGQSLPLAFTLWLMVLGEARA